MDEFRRVECCHDVIAAWLRRKEELNAARARVDAAVAAEADAKALVMCMFEARANRPIIGATECYKPIVGRTYSAFSGSRPIDVEVIEGDSIWEPAFPDEAAAAAPPAVAEPETAEAATAGGGA